MRWSAAVAAIAMLLTINLAFAEVVGEARWPLPLDDDFLGKGEVVYSTQETGKELARWLTTYRCYLGFKGRQFPKRYGIIFGKVDAKYEKRPEVYEENGKQKKRDRWYLLSYNSKTYQLCPEKPFIHRSPFGRMKRYIWGNIQTKRVFSGYVRKTSKALGFHVARYCGVIPSYRPLPYAFYVAAVTDVKIEGKRIDKISAYFGVECFGTKKERDAYAYEIAVKLGVIKPKSRTQPKGKGRGG